MNHILYNFYWWKFTLSITFTDLSLSFLPSLTLTTGSKGYYENQYFLTFCFLRFQIQICYDYKFNYKLSYHKEDYSNN